MTARGPQRRAEDHVHPEYWTEDDHHRFEAKLTAEVKSVRQEVRAELGEISREVRGLNNRLTMMMGGLVLIAFLLPIAAPFIRGALGLP